MLKSIVIFSLVSSMNFVEARSERYNVKGLKLYIHHCKSCHGNPYKYAESFSSKKWNKFFKNDAKKLNSKHSKKGVAKELFNEKLSKKRIMNLKDFLINSASDMGVVPGCDGNYC